MSESKTSVSPFPEDPPSCKFEDYFCSHCGGLTHLPGQLIIEQRLLRWCICHWNALQNHFASAVDFYMGQDEPQEKNLRLVADQEKHTA